MYIYEGHMGDLYATDSELDIDELYCEACGDYDWLIGYAATREEAWELLEEDTNTFDPSLCEICSHNGEYNYCNFECESYQHSGGWSYDYVKAFLDENFGDADETSDDEDGYADDCDYDVPKDNCDLYEDDTLKFIWGVKSYDDLSEADACLHTMNDIDIVYNKEKKVYVLGLETIYMFDNFLAECAYLKGCLDSFTQYMDENGLSKNEPYRLFMSNGCTSIEAETIEELYTNFKIFVDGFCMQRIEEIKAKIL